MDYKAAWLMGLRQRQRRSRRVVEADIVTFARKRLGFVADPRQEELLRTGSKRVLLNCTRQWGKSTVAAVVAVHRLYTVPGSLVVVVSPSARQSGELLGKAARFLRRLGERVRGGLTIRLRNGSRLVGLPGKEATVRGFSAVDLLLVDEAARVPDELYRAVRPMLAVSGGALWLMSTPFGKRGFFWEAWSSRADLEEGWVRVSVPATDCPRMPAEFLEEERRSGGERWFAQEYLCAFTDHGDALFREELVRRAFREEIRALFTLMGLWGMEITGLGKMGTGDSVHRPWHRRGFGGTG